MRTMRISGVIVTLGAGVLGVLFHSTPESPPHAGEPRLARVANAAAGNAGNAAPPAVVKVEDLPPVELRKLTPQELTPTLIRKSETLVWKFDDSPIGTEFLLEADGNSFIARFEQHFHEWGGPVRPWGPHKGITLYAAE